MEIGLVGVGRMGSVLAKLLIGHVKLCLFDRNSEHLCQMAKELNSRMVTNLKDMEKIGVLILAVPDNEVIGCIKEFNQSPHPMIIINIATNIAQYMLDEIVASHVKCISIKFIGQADEMALGQRPVIIINKSPVEIVPQMIELFQRIGQVLVGEADIVHFINKTAAKGALEAAVSIEERLREEGITDKDIIKSAIRHVAAGTLKAYADGNMGPFAREIVESVRNRLVNS